MIAIDAKAEAARLVSIKIADQARADAARLANIRHAFAEQKDAILRLANDDGIEQAVSLFRFVRNAWQRADYGYKATEVADRLKKTCWDLIREEQAFIDGSRKNGRGVSSARHRIDALSNLINLIGIQ